MRSSETQKLVRNLILPAVSLGALLITFFAANSNFNFQIKLFIFFTVVLFYLLFFGLFYFRGKHQVEFLPLKKDAADSPFSADVERQLLALEDASEFFGSSLKPADMFRLVSSRINQMTPFAASALFWSDEESKTLKIVGAAGENAREMMNAGTISPEGLAGKSFTSRKIQFDEDLSLEKKAVSPEALANLDSAIAVPLLENNRRAFAVFVLYGDTKRKFDAKTEILLEAIAERTAPLFLSSLAFERSLSNALTDVLTSLPNERAFYLILENQIAESQRRREERPLTILAIDIKGFADLNQNFGHATGDRILSFVAETIKGQLRKMDFISRSLADEFLVVLPTAGENIADEIIERIETALGRSRFEVDADEAVHLGLNFGAASFWRDGETAQQLLNSARLRKRNEKYTPEDNILLFPKEFVN
jgi:diguanylate cyclase (GGDEF)-like protein